MHLVFSVIGIVLLVITLYAILHSHGDVDDELLYVGNGWVCESVNLGRMPIIAMIPASLAIVYGIIAHKGHTRGLLVEVHDLVDLLFVFLLLLACMYNYLIWKKLRDDQVVRYVG